MLVSLVCPHGHQWKADFSNAAGEPICALCGEVGRPATDETRDADRLPETRQTSPLDPDQIYASSVPLDHTEDGAPRPPTPPFVAGYDEPPALPVLGNYELQAELGRGGMGVVYRALDRRHGQVVALKTMRRFSPEMLYRFKQEFRSRADLIHANLVNLYELVAEDGQWFFTMELVDGVDFLTYVRGGHDRVAKTPSGRPIESPAAFSRLRAALSQLAAGIVALHQSGKLHRDLKPGNVLVTGADRVVVLDFGLVAELDPLDGQQSTEGKLLGTVQYMAPEQAACLTATPAADWYSIGVILYEALTGRLPFTGSQVQILQDKQTQEPPPPQQFANGLPEDLASLCIDLLRRDPAGRPTGEEVLRRLGTTPVHAASNPRTPGLLVGRERHLSALTEAFKQVRNGKAKAVFLAGQSGAGKSTLARHFLDGLREGGEVVILEGHCNEQESVPYKAFDGAIDVLSRLLGRLPPAEQDAVLPRDVISLLRVFPVLRRAIETRRAGNVPDPQEVRRRAFAGLRELLARLGDRRLLVLCLDDLQWGDADSAALLAELLRPPDPPVLLLLGSYRSEEVTASPFLRMLGEIRKESEAAVDWQEITVDALTRTEARDLAVRLLGSSQAAMPRADAIARESGGNPFFVHELAQAVQSGSESLSGAISLDLVLWDRIERLPEQARDLLAVVATASRPLSQSEVLRAAGLAADTAHVLAALRSWHLIRGTGLTEEDVLTTYHDRIREAIASHLPNEVKRDVHRRLAETLEQTGHSDPETLAVHFEGAGAAAKAGQYYAVAADQAAEALAFVHAAKLYRRALELSAAGEDIIRTLKAKLGDALANAGLGIEAAAVYLEAAEGLPPIHSLELERKAAFQAWISGHVDKALPITKQVLNSIGLQIPSSTVRTLVGLLWLRAGLWLRGKKFRERPPQDIPAETLSRLDTVWSIAQGMALIDPLLSAYFQGHNLKMALATGDAYRYARALALEVGHTSTEGTPVRKKTARLLQEAEDVVKRVKKPHTDGLFLLVTGLSSYFEGRWSDSVRACRDAETIFQDRCIGVQWELNASHTFQVWSLIFMGKIAELSSLYPRLLQAARDRGDLFGYANLATFAQPVVRLAEDQPESACSEMDESLSKWTKVGFHVQHFNALNNHIWIDLYRGLGDEALGRVDALWKSIRESFQIRIQHVRTIVNFVSGLALLMAAAQRPSAGNLLAKVASHAGKLRKENRTDASAMAFTLDGGLAVQQGKAELAAKCLEQAVELFEKASMGLYAASNRRRLGQLVKGDRGKELVAAADAWMANQGIRNPACMASVFAPTIRD